MQKVSGMKKEDEIAFYLKKFLELDKNRDRDEEMVVLTKLIELDPYCETHYYNRGVLYGYLDQLGKAIADYTKAVELNPKHTLARGNRGVCYFDLGDLDSAIWDIAWAVKIDPGSIHSINLPNMYYWRAEKNAKEGRTDKVIEDCNYLITNFPNYFLIDEVRKILEDAYKKTQKQEEAA